MERVEIDPAIAVRAEKLQQRADKYTAFRKSHSDKLGIAVGLTRRNWLTFFGACYMAFTDFKDGYDAKRAQRLLCADKPLSNGATEDPAADKVFRRALINGMELRAAAENDLATLTLLSYKRRVDSSRDARMVRNRELAARYTDLGLGALQINRVKTATEMAGILLHISPPANNESIRNVALGLMAISSAIGLAGERKYSKMVQRNLAVATDPPRLDVSQPDNTPPPYIEPIHHSLTPPDRNTEAA